MVVLERGPVHADPEILGGTLVLQGTRVPNGYSLEEFLDFFPSVKREDAREFLKIARDGQ